MEKTVHRSVLLQDSISFLNIKSGIYIDCTLGGGGYTLLVQKKLQEKGGGTIVAFDLDRESINRFKNLLSAEEWVQKGDGSFLKGKVEIILVHSNFSELAKELAHLQLKDILGIVADLGVSSDQIDNPERGFSYMHEGPLDMRMDERLGVKAQDLVNGLYENELKRLFWESDERFGARIAREIVEERSRSKITTTSHLIKIIRKALPYKKGMSTLSNRSAVGTYWIKPAMRVFQALRIAVNSELSSLQVLLPQALETLKAGGRFVVVTFHSGEDRIVKDFFKEKKRIGKIKVLTEKPILPGEEEIRENNRARSAKLRAFEKL